MAHSAQPYQCAHSPAPTPMRFCPAVATAIGVSEAIVLHRLDYWLGRSKHRIKGRAWVYNTYDAWQEQFPFWSRRTIQATFRRLERLGVVESTQAHNRSRWDKTKWYTIDYDKLAELVPETMVEGPANDESVEASSMAGAAANDGAADAVIDDAEASPSWKTIDSPMRSSIEIPERAGTSEPDEEAHLPALEAAEPEVKHCHLGENPVNELDAAYEAIPEAERGAWYERADETLEVAGMPEWMRIAPTVREMALRLWVGETIPALASG